MFDPNSSDNFLSRQNFCCTDDPANGDYLIPEIRIIKAVLELEGEKIWPTLPLTPNL